MSVKLKLCDNPCDTCDKKGLPILLTRYAIAPADSGAPQLKGTLGGAEINGVPLGAKAHYTLRLVRSGYVYVYDERGYWEEYAVTDDGIYIKLPPRVLALKQAPAPVAGTFACARNGAAPLAATMTVRNPKQAKALWVGYSDVQWTQTTFADHAKPEVRQRHMTRIVLSGGKVSPQAHAAVLDDLPSLVTEYALSPAQGERHFKAWNPFGYKARQSQTKALLDQVKVVRPQGGAAVVALYDPVGMAAELAALANHRLATFHATQQWAHPLAVSSAIEQLRNQIEREAAERAAVPVTGRGGVVMDTLERRRERAEQAAQRAWNKYLNDYREQDRLDFQTQYQTVLQSFDQSDIAPLAQAHAAWLKHARTQRHFEANFDSADPESGAVYTATVSLALGGGQDKAPVAVVLADWFKGRLTDKTNLLLRGLVLNQDTLAQELHEAAQPQYTDWKQYPWDALSANVNKALEHVLEGKADYVGVLLKQSFGALSQALKQAALTGKLGDGLLAAGVLTQKPLLRVRVSDSQKNIARLVTQAMYEYSGQSPCGLHQSVVRRLHWLQAQGVNLAQANNVHTVVYLDLDSLRARPAPGSTQAQRRAVLSQAVLSAADLQSLAPSAWRASVRQGASVIKGNMPLAGGVVGAAVQMMMLGSLSQDLDKALQQGRGQEQARWKYNAMLASLFGTVSETLGEAMKKWPTAVLRRGRGMTSALLKFFGIGLGLLGAGVVAVLEWNNATDARDRGQLVLAVFYRTNDVIGFTGTLLLIAGASGLIASAALAAALTGIGILLVLVAVVLTIAIDVIKPNAIEEWLESGYFGKKAFSQVEAEMKDLRTRLSSAGA
jgi:hypothetical protein